MDYLKTFYIDNVELLTKLAKERKLPTRSFNELALENVKRSILSILESSGGSAEPNLNSDHKEERALAHMLEALKELDLNNQIDDDVHNTLKELQELLGDNFVNIRTRMIDGEVSIFVTTMNYEINRTEIIKVCSGMNRLFELDIPKDNVNQFMIHLTGV